MKMGLVPANSQRGGDDSPTPSLSIWDIYNDNRGQLLFALDNGKVYRFNGISFEIFLAPVSDTFE